jgi:chromosomal replication initiator protein
MDLTRLWKNTQEELRVVIAPAVYQTFVAHTQLIKLENNQATIGCANEYLADLNRRRYHQLFKSALDHQTQQTCTLNFITSPITPSVSTPSPAPLFDAPAFVPIAKTNLHPKYTFANLVVGNSNNFAFAAAQGIVANPGTIYNPFFIWGGVGVGKTHLMQAIGHELLQKNSQLKIRYFPAETFGNELIAALKSKTINQFKDRYRSADCILVDDIQFIAGKEYIQEEFFHTFNALHLNGKQVILTSDRKPSDILGLADRLVSRFLGGLTVDIQPPDLEMRHAIIRQKFEDRGLTIDSPALSYMAQNLVSNIRDIEGTIQKLSVQALSKKISQITLDLIQISSENTPNTLSHQSITPRHLISICAKFFDLKTGDLCGTTRTKHLVAARHLTAYLLLSELKLPLQDVGRLLGGRDHTSIIHARDKIAHDLSTNPQTQQLLQQIKQQLSTTQ